MSDLIQSDDVPVNLAPSLAYPSVYPLYPFPEQPRLDQRSESDLDLPSLQLQTVIDRSGSHLQITFDLTGPIADLQPEQMAVSKNPKRCMALWETTCFECFLGVPGEAHYWEMNLAVTGDWNLFRLDRYRENLQEEPRIQAIPIALEKHSNQLKLTAHLDLDALGIGAEACELSVASVIQTRSGFISYWAVNHAGPEPDFHLRQSFVIKLS